MKKNLTFNSVRATAQNNGEIVMSNGDEIELSLNNKEAFIKLFKNS